MKMHAKLGLLAVLAVGATVPAPAVAGKPVPLKEAKLIIEHNATDQDTGFQGFVDSEGWKSLDVIGPNGAVLHFEGRGELGELGLTELFFETVEPENKDVPIDELLEQLPAGEYRFKGVAMIDGESSGETTATATFSHAIPEGPALVEPVAGAKVPAEGLVMRWRAVDRSISGEPVEIVGYQLIVERDTEPDPNMIGKWGLSMYLPGAITSMALPKGFLQPGTPYKWEVLAIEKSGNQTLCCGEFSTR